MPPLVSQLCDLESVLSILCASVSLWQAGDSKNSLCHPGWLWKLSAWLTWRTQNNTWNIVTGQMEVVTSPPIKMEMSGTFLLVRKQALALHQMTLAWKGTWQLMKSFLSQILFLHEEQSLFPTEVGVKMVLTLRLFSGVIYIELSWFPFPTLHPSPNRLEKENKPLTFIWCLGLTERFHREQQSWSYY